MLVIVAPPIVMGAWSMAFLLGQHVEYYYYTYYSTLTLWIMYIPCYNKDYNVVGLYILLSCVATRVLDVE